MIEQTKQYDPSLAHEYVGGPLDGRRSADLPPQLSGQSLTGLVANIPLSQPQWFALHAVYICQGEAQVDGFWQFDFERLEGPNGEVFVAAQQPVELVSTGEAFPTTQEGQ